MKSLFRVVCLFDRQRKSEVPAPRRSYRDMFKKNGAFLLLLVLLCSGPGMLLPLGAVTLKAKDNQEFDRYAHGVEQALKARASQGKMGGFPAATGKAGDLVIESPLKDNPKDLGSAYIHDWVGRAFLPGVKAKQLVHVLKDYNNHKRYYAPDVQDSRLVGHRGEELLSFLRIQRKKIITVTLASDYRSRFVEVSPAAGYSLSHSTSIREVENAGESDEKELPHGEGNGFLWRLNAYWAWNETPEGLWVECRAVSLSRSTPTGLGWAVNPVIRNLPKESLESTISNTRKAVQGIQQ